MYRTSYTFPTFIQSSKYAQKMRKLECKIFNEYYVPELPKKDLEYGIHHHPVQVWSAQWFSAARVVERTQDKPSDLNHNKTHHFYPAHPQIRLATHTLREYGLYRDEHRDFNEAMKKVLMARGKNFRQKGGSLKSKDKK